MTTKPPPYLILKAIYFLLILLLFFHSAPARAETVTCTEVIPPTSIDVSGVHCLKQDHELNMMSGVAVSITVSDVYFDQGTYEITNTAGASTLASAIVVDPALIGVTIRNGTIKGWYFPIYIQDIYPEFSTGGGHVIEDMTFEDNYWKGIHITGKGNIVRRNKIDRVGGTTSQSNVFGILSYGRGLKAYDNSVNDLFCTDPNGIAVGIDPAYWPDGARIVGNTVTNIGRDCGQVYSIAQPILPGRVGAPLEADTLISNNIVKNPISEDFPFEGSVGIWCLRDDQVFATNNYVQGFETPYFRCADGGLNLP